MSFQAYLDAVKAKTGKTPAELKTAAEEAGVYGPDMTATQLVDWLKSQYGLGQGHSMAVWAVFKGNGWTHAPGK
jgi:Domain of unknown function (DUF4287)